MVEVTSMACAVDGVEIGLSGFGRWVHLGGLPKGVDPEHEADPISRFAFQQLTMERGSLRDVALDMLGHHIAIHPTSDCAFSERLREALREVSTGVNT